LRYDGGLDVLEKWLRHEEPTAYTDVLQVREVVADADAEGEDLNWWLARELVRNYFSPANRAVLVKVLRDLGVDELAAHVLKNKFPDDPKVRTGEFGEALVGAVLRKIRRYTVPILKLRFKHRPNAPVQGADLVAFRLSVQPPVIAVPEVKTRGRRKQPDLNVGKEAHDSLAGAISTLDASIEFVAARLLEQGNQAVGSRVMDLLADESKVVERHVFVVHEDDQWDARVIDRLSNVVTEKTEATVIRMREVQARIATTYAEAARAVRPDSWQVVASTLGEEASGA